MHLLLSFGVKTNMTCDKATYLSVANQFTDTNARPAVSLAITVSSYCPYETSSSIMQAGVPTAIKPPIIRIEPLGIIATASLTGTIFMLSLLCSADPLRMATGIHNVG